MSTFHNSSFPRRHFSFFLFRGDPFHPFDSHTRIPFQLQFPPCPPLRFLNPRSLLRVQRGRSFVQRVIGAECGWDANKRIVNIQLSGNSVSWHSTNENFFARESKQRVDRDSNIKIQGVVSLESSQKKKERENLARISFTFRITSLLLRV